MLSVFITPWTKPTSIHCATSAAWAATTASKSARYGVLGVGGRRVVPRDGVVGQAAQQVGVAGGPRRTGRCRPAGGCSRPARSTAPGSTRLAPHRRARSRPRPSARVVGMPSACIASLTTYSRSIGPTAASPSPPRENGVRPEPLRCRSRSRPCRRPARRAAAPGRRRGAGSSRRTGAPRRPAPRASRPPGPRCRRAARRRRGCAASRGRGRARRPAARSARAAAAPGASAAGHGSASSASSSAKRRPRVRAGEGAVVTSSTIRGNSPLTPRGGA